MTKRIMDGQLRTPQIDARINQRRSLDMRHNAPVDSTARVLASARRVA
ncbi:MAG: hypothetical protein V3U39_04285 [Acidimicrobiia bacterium]